VKFQLEGRESRPSVVGFGPPQSFHFPEGDIVENDLLSNPFGLDLMISFFYSAVWALDKRRLDLFFPSSVCILDINNQLLGFANEVF
jgi:hypothetical protein